MLTRWLPGNVKRPQELSCMYFGEPKIWVQFFYLEVKISIPALPRSGRSLLPHFWWGRGARGSQQVLGEQKQETKQIPFSNQTLIWASSNLVHKKSQHLFLPKRANKVTKKTAFNRGPESKSSSWLCHHPRGRSEHYVQFGKHRSRAKKQ